MLGLMIRRSFHITRTVSASKTSILAKLRKSTGYPLTNCKKAVELFPDDFAKAEEWLNAEANCKGWSKWAKIQTRTATQGLIGVCSRDNVGVMVEVNCETDFVSRNADFQLVVEKMLSGCLSYAENLRLENDISKTVLDEPQLNAIPCESSTLGELVVAATMKFNEKTIAKRAVFLKVPEDVMLNCLTHPANVCPNLDGASLGKYGVLLASKEKKNDNIEAGDLDASALRLNLCHHIIGMNPLLVGELTEKDIAKFSKKNSDVTKSDDDIDNVENKVENTQSGEKPLDVRSAEGSGEAETEEQESVESELKESNETALLFQPYLMDPTITVGETLLKSGIDILAFERFECGEIAEESPKVAVAASG